MDGSDALEPDFRQVRCTIHQVAPTAHSHHLLVVHPAKAIHFSDDFAVEDLLLVGIDMDVVAELFGTSKRPQGLPVLAAIWRAKDLGGMVSRVEAGKAPASSEEYLGRGEIRLEE